MKTNTFRITALCGCFLLALGTLAADEQQAEKSKPRPAPAPLTVPAGAVQKDANTYTYTDEPRETTQADQENIRKDAALIQAFDDGDSVRFERPGPFGVYRWKQKKTELSAVEQAAWDRARARKDGAREKE
jgi:hypothetical protein